MLLFPAVGLEAADACGNNIVICSHTGSYGDINASRAANMRAKLSNGALFGPTGSLLPETFSFVSIPSITASTLATNSCQVYFSGYDRTTLIDTTEQLALNTWVNSATDRYIIGGCDSNGFDSVCDAVGRSVTNYFNIPVNLNGSTLLQNPLLCTGSSVVEISGGASGYFTNFGSDVELAHYNDAAALPETITDTLTGNGKYLLTGDINMWVTPNPAISAGSGVTLSNDFFIVNSFKFAADNICGRISSSGPICPGSVAPADYGDAPTSYGSPNHEITAGIYLGNALPDSESSGQPSANADGDDTTDNDDEDGVSTFPALSEGDSSYTLPSANITVQGSGTLHAWIDFDGDGNFTSTEYAASSVTTGNLANALSWNGQNTTASGNTYVRLRLSSGTLTDNPANTTLDERSTVAANDGEVEDYHIPVAPPLVATITGTVYQDNNGSNTQNAGEAGIANITLELFDDGGTATDVSDDVLIASTSSGADGSYQFTGVNTGTFRVSVDTNDPDLPANTLIGTSNPVYTISTSPGSSHTANFGFDSFACVPGGGVSDPAVAAYTSTEVKGTGINARNTTDTLDDSWRTDAGLPLTGTVIPWLGHTAQGLANNEPVLFTTRGVDVGVALVNIQPNAPCDGNVHTSGGPNLSTSNTMQQTSPRPASLYTAGSQPAFWNESSGHNGSPNGVRFSFAQPVKAFGAWFGDLETRTDGFGPPAYLRLLDAGGNRIGADIAIDPQTISNGATTSAVDQNQCGSSASETGCGNRSTRWVGFIDNAISPRIRQAIIIVGDDDFADLGGSESLSFIGMDINTGYDLSGRVYHDSNVNGNDDTEAGIGQVNVVLHDTAAGSCRSTQTNADGYYVFHDVQIANANNYTVYEAAQAAYSNTASCPPNASDPNGFVSSTSNARTVTISDADVSGIDFGDVAEPHFSQDNEQTILPNTSVAHPHRFTSPSEGTVSFNLTTYADPAGISWGHGLYLDSNCDAKLDSSDLLLNGSLAVNAGQQLCLLVKVIAPANAGNGAMHTVQITSDFSYGDGNTGLANHQQMHTDLTTLLNNSVPNPVRGEGKLALLKSVWNVSRNINGDVALPGETLRYSIAYENVGDGPLNELIISDNLPAFTQLIPGSLLCSDRPAGLAACNIVNSGSGEISWRWTSTDKLQSGASGSVSYEVIVE